MSKTFICFFALPFFAAGFAHAADHPMKSYFPGADTCYARVYSAQHLKSHPLQRVSSMQIVHPFGSAAGIAQFRMGLRYTLKGKKGAYGPISVYCDPASGDTLKCSIEGDMGRFTLKGGKDNSLIVNVERIEVEGQHDFSPDLGKGGDDRVIVLQRSPMKACPGNKK